MEDSEPSDEITLLSNGATQLEDSLLGIEDDVGTSHGSTLGASGSGSNDKSDRPDKVDKSDTLDKSEKPVKTPKYERKKNPPQIESSNNRKHFSTPSKN